MIYIFIVFCSMCNIFKCVIFIHKHRVLTCQFLARLRRGFYVTVIYFKPTGVLVKADMKSYIRLQMAAIFLLSNL